MLFPHMPAPWRNLFYKSPDGAGGGDGGSGGGAGGGSSSSSSSQADGSGSGGGGGGSSNDDDAKNKSELERARNEAAKFRTERNTLRTELETLKNSGKTDEQKTADKIKELQDKLEGYTARERSARTVEAISEMAAELKPKNAARVAKLLIAEGIEVDDDGDPKKPKDVKKALEALKTEMPELFQSGGAQGKDAGAGAGSGGAPKDMNDYLRTRFFGRR